MNLRETPFSALVNELHYRLSTTHSSKLGISSALKQGLLPLIETAQLCFLESPADPEPPRPPRSLSAAQDAGWRTRPLGDVPDHSLEALSAQGCLFLYHSDTKALWVAIPPQETN